MKRSTGSEQGKLEGGKESGGRKKKKLVRRRGGRNDLVTELNERKIKGA